MHAPRVTRSCSARSAASVTRSGAVRPRRSGTSSAACDRRLIRYHRQVTTPTIEAQVREACVRARQAARALAPRKASEKDAALEAIARGLEAHGPMILDANR